jgi:serine phosphatase RsbU (regulator of sigma subunit)
VVGQRRPDVRAGAGAQPAGAAAYLERFVHPEDRARVEQLIRGAVEHGTSYEHDLRVALPEGGERYIHSRVHVVEGPDGRPERLIGLMSDVTERRLREDRRAYLAEASEALAASMDPVKTLDEIARLTVPRLADWCAIQLAPEVRGSFEQIAVAHVDPEKVRWAWELAERYPPDPDAPTGAPAVVRTGRSELYPEIDEALMQAAALDDEQRALVAELQMRSAMVVPLAARDRTLGAITFVFAESGRQYSTRELELAEELGRRAGLALDHARLFAREHATAETLQRALLPSRIPELPGHRLIVRYVASDARDHVGGDWYDAFRLPSGRFGIAIGDVGGRGIAAAATMGQLRNALRAYALKGARPAQVIDDLHALADAAEGEIGFATLLYLELDVATGEGEFAIAGHLPPLVVDAAGTATYAAAATCPPLGASDAPPCRSSRLVLPSGGALWLYTDGLVESRRQPIDTGMGALAAAAAGGGDLDAIADAMLASLPGSREDDVALLGLKRLAPERVKPPR